MEIKGAYSEHEKKEIDFDIFEDYSPIFSPYGSNMTAGKFLKQQPDGMCFAFRFSKTEEQVRDEFLKNIPNDASEEFINEAKLSLKIYKTYMPVEYFTVKEYETTSLEATKHYKTTGYTATGSFSGNTLNVDVSENKEYSHTTYDYKKQTKKANDKIYYTELDRYLSVFNSKFYSTVDSDSSNLVTADDIIDDSLLQNMGANFYRHPTYGSVKNYELHQILLFPLWRVEVKFNNNIYVNYVSDIDKSEVVYYNKSQEAKEKEISELMKKKKSYKRAKLFTDIVVSVVGTLLAISLLAHFFCSTTAADSDGYSGLLCNAFGGFGVFLTLLGGFSLIGYIFVIAGISIYISMENLSNLKFIKNSEIPSLKEKFTNAPSKFKLIIGLSLAGLVIFGIETVFFIMFL